MVDDTLKRLGRRIREIRIQRGFVSQEAFADYLKLHRTFIGHLETGRKDFRMTTVIRVAEALRVPLSELFASLENDAAFAANPKEAAAFDREAVRKELEKLERGVRKLKESM